MVAIIVRPLPLVHRGMIESDEIDPRDADPTIFAASEEKRAGIRNPAGLNNACPSMAG